MANPNIRQYLSDFALPEAILGSVITIDGRAMEVREIVAERRVWRRVAIAVSVVATLVVIGSCISFWMLQNQTPRVISITVPGR